MAVEPYVSERLNSCGGSHRRWLSADGFPLCVHCQTGYRNFSYSFQAGADSNPNAMLMPYMGLFSSLLVLIRAHPMSRAWAIDFNLIAVAIPLRRQARRTPVNRIPQSVELRSKGLANVSPA